MKLALIVNCWGDWSMLRQTLPHLRPLVDGVIVIGSYYSNYGEYFPIPEDFHNEELFVREPKFHIPLHSETDKRNYGLEVAVSKGYTHFLSADADEVYKADEFLKAKERFHVEHNLQGLVCPCEVFFSSPTLTLGRDVTLVPFIHKLTQSIRHEFNRKYPNAWINNQIRIDPSRSLNISSGVEYTEEVTMFHYSWVRDDYERKIRNSTARNNIQKSTILKDLLHAEDGYYVEFYRKRLTRCPNLFGIHEFSKESNGVIRENLQSGAARDGVHHTD
jgi:hypothetical protein